MSRPPPVSERALADGALGAGQGVRGARGVLGADVEGVQAVPDMDGEGAGWEGETDHSAMTQLSILHPSLTVRANSPFPTISNLSPVHRFPVERSPIHARLHSSRQSPLLPDGVTLLEETMAVYPAIIASVERRRASAARGRLVKEVDCGSGQSSVCVFDKKGDGAGGLSPISATASLSPKSSLDGPAISRLSSMSSDGCSTNSGDAAERQARARADFEASASHMPPTPTLPPLTTCSGSPKEGVSCEAACSKPRPVSLPLLLSSRPQSGANPKLLRSQTSAI